MTDNNDRNRYGETEKKTKIISVIVYLIMAAGAVIFGMPILSYLVLMAVMFIPSRTYYYIIAAALILLLVLFISNLALRKKPDVKKKVKKYIALSFVLLAVLTVGNITYDVWESKFYVAPNDVNLWDYNPDNTDNLLVELDEEPILMITEDWPVINGATALYPIYAAYVNEVYEKSEEMWRDDFDNMLYDLLRYTTSTAAYDLLINGKTDILFVSGPSEKQLEDAKEAGVEFDMYPIGREAFVFFVSVENPVDDLSAQDIKDIYSGEVRNWSKLGGDFKRIRAFQRPEGSGSQTALENIMGETPLMPAMMEDSRAGMGGIITKTAEYTNFESAIGFSFRFFATQIYPSDEIKLLSVNGIEPTEENIRNGSYPFISDIYMVKLKDNNDENVLKFIEWVQSEQGIYILEQTGYVSSLK